MIRVDGDHWIKTVSTTMYITSVKPVLYSHPLPATLKTCIYEPIVRL